MKAYSIESLKERKKIISCIICGAHNTSKYWQGDDFSYARCKSCGHIYQNPQPIWDELKKRYQREYFIYEKTNEKAFFKLMLLGLQDIGFHRIEKKLSDNDKSFLDIGCATGLLLKHIQDRGWKVQGVEISEPSATFGIREREIPIFIGTLEEASFKPESFSFIHFSHLIEHVPNPKRFLYEVRRILKADGSIVVVTPNADGMQAKLLRNKWRLALADHVHLFSKRTLKILLEQCGFDITTIVTWGGLEKGLAPHFIKKPIDFLAKKFGFGDVVLFHAKKS